MDYITINNQQIPYPNGFKMSRMPNKVATLTTMNGNTICDINGWKYETQTFQWDTLLEADLNALLQAVSQNEFSMTFVDIDGTHTVTAVLESRVSTKTRYRCNGQILWRDINMTLSFPTCYHD